jgi:hypothetical protein
MLGVEQRCERCELSARCGGGAVDRCGVGCRERDAFEHVEDRREQLVHALLVADVRLLARIDQQYVEHRLAHPLAAKELDLGKRSFDVLLDLLLQASVLKIVVPRTLKRNDTKQKQKGEFTHTLTIKYKRLNYLFGLRKRVVRRIAVRIDKVALFQFRVVCSSVVELRHPVAHRRALERRQAPFPQYASQRRSLQLAARRFVAKQLLESTARMQRRPFFDVLLHRLYYVEYASTICREK